MILRIDSTANKVEQQQADGTWAPLATQSTTPEPGGDDGTPTDPTPTDPTPTDPVPTDPTLVGCGDTSGWKSARPDGSLSAADYKSLQEAINAAKGKVLFVPKGTYKISTPLNLVDGIQVVGEQWDQTILQGPGSLIIKNVNPANKWSLKNLTLVAGGIQPEGNTSNVPADVEISQCCFRDLKAPYGGDYTQRCFIFAWNGVLRWNVHHNLFQNLTLPDGSMHWAAAGDKAQDPDGGQPRCAFWAYGFHNTTIRNNTFKNVYQGLKSFQSRANVGGKSNYVGYNLFNVHRMPIEIQDGNAGGVGTFDPDMQDLVFEWNDISFVEQYWESYGISLPCLRSNNTWVRFNTIKYQPYASPNRGIPIEIGGRNFKVQGNVIQAIGNQLAAGFFQYSTGGQCWNNWVCNLTPSQGTPGFKEEHNYNTGTKAWNNTVVNNPVSALPKPNTAA